ncbi:MAG: hypothetical protein HC927_05785 [Deltaproteobacteria bacterium]|nr:hypothetical protein [Deltaproteobacteria bacterium]
MRAKSSSSPSSSSSFIRPDFGIPARKYFADHGEHARVLLLDDLEWHYKDDRQAVFDRYCQVFDTLLTAEQRHRAAVFFFVMMLEAYYFADPETLCAVLQLDKIPEHLRDIDVETAIRHPKNELKGVMRARGRSFDEKADGLRVIEQLVVERALAHPERCASLRTLFRWCADALDLPADVRSRLLDGALCPVTGSQLRNYTVSD